MPAKLFAFSTRCTIVQELLKTSRDKNPGGRGIVRSSSLVRRDFLKHGAAIIAAASSSSLMGAAQSVKTKREFNAHQQKRRKLLYKLARTMIFADGRYGCVISSSKYNKFRAKSVLIRNRSSTDCAAI